MDCSVKIHISAEDSINLENLPPSTQILHVKKNAVASSEFHGERLNWDDIELFECSSELRLLPSMPLHDVPLLPLESPAINSLECVLQPAFARYRKKPSVSLLQPCAWSATVKKRAESGALKGRVMSSRYLILRGLSLYSFQNSKPESEAKHKFFLPGLKASVLQSVVELTDADGKVCLHVDCGSTECSTQLIEAICAAQWSFLSAIAAQCFAHIRQNGIASEGIFRISCDDSLMKTLLTQATSYVNMEFSSTDGEGYGAAALLKQLIREFPAGIIDSRCYKDAMSCVSAQTDKKASSQTGTQNGTKCSDGLDEHALKTAFQLLPSRNRAFLLQLFVLLRDVAESSHLNKMTALNLAKVFAPTLFQPSMDSASFNPMAALTEASKAETIVHTCIERCFQIFESESWVLRDCRFTKQSRGLAANTSGDISAKTGDLFANEKPMKCHKPVASSSNIACSPEVENVQSAFGDQNNRQLLVQLENKEAIIQLQASKIDQLMGELNRKQDVVTALQGELHELKVAYRNLKSTVGKQEGVQTEVKADTSRTGSISVRERISSLQVQQQRQTDVPSICSGPLIVQGSLVDSDEENSHDVDNGSDSDSDSGDLHGHGGGSALRLYSQRLEAAAVADSLAHQQQNNQISTSPHTSVKPRERLGSIL